MIGNAMITVPPIETNEEERQKQRNSLAIAIQNWKTHDWERNIADRSWVCKKCGLSSWVGLVLVNRCEHELMKQALK